MWREVLGWAATAVFSISYFLKEAAALRKIQAGGAILWLLYGIAIHSLPVIVANVIVAAAAIYTSVFGVQNRR